MNRIICFVSLVFCIAARFVTADDTASTLTYAQSSVYTLGTCNLDSPSKGYVVQTDAELFIPGMTLDEFDAQQYCLMANFCGQYVATELRGAICPARNWQTYKGEDGKIEKAIAIFTFKEGSNTKSVTVEFTNGEDGIYAKGLRAALYKAVNLNYLFVKLNDDGTYTYNGTTYDVATTYSTKKAYGICNLRAFRLVPETSSITVWTSPGGTDVLTLDDIKEHKFSARLVGGSFSKQEMLGEGYNTRVFEDEAGFVTNIVTEFQVADDASVKCVVVSFTDGVDGVMATALKSRYGNLSEGYYLGYPFVNDDGSYSGRPNDVATSLTDWGYAVYGLSAVPVPSVAFVLDRSKTWSELTTGAELGDRDTVIKISITADSPVLTFDTAVDRAKITFSSETTNTVSFVRAAGCSTFTLDVLEFGENLLFTNEVSLAAGAVNVASGSTVVFAPAEQATVTSEIVGKGGVEIASGVVTLAATNSYFGGTLVRSGAKLLPGVTGSWDGVIRLGPFGMVSPSNVLKIENGGQLDLNGFLDAGCYAEVEGENPIVNTVDAEFDWNMPQMYGLSLAGDTTFTNLNGYGINVPETGNPSTYLHLNGHTLTKKGPGTFRLGTKNGFTSSEPGLFILAEGSVTVHNEFSSRGLSAGEMYFVVEPGTVLSNLVGTTFRAITNNGTIALSPRVGPDWLKSMSNIYEGTGVVVKTSSGTASAPFTSGPNRYYDVREGTLQVQSNKRPSATYAFVTEENPRANQLVEVRDGATFDMTGFSDVNVSVRIAGSGVNGKGAFINSAKSIPKNNSQCVQLILSDDATVGGDGNFGILAPSYGETRLELGEYTLSVDMGTNDFFLSNTKITGAGTVEVKSGMFEIRGAKSSIQDELSLFIAEGAKLKYHADIMTKIRDLENHGTIELDNNYTYPIVVSGTLTATTNEIPYLALTDGAVINITSTNTSVKVTGGFSATGTVTVNAPNLEIEKDGRVPVLIAPAGTDFSGVTFVAGDIPSGIVLTANGSAPVLTNCGLIILIR